MLEGWLTDHDSEPTHDVARLGNRSEEEPTARGQKKHGRGHGESRQPRGQEAAANAVQSGLDGSPPADELGFRRRPTDAAAGGVGQDLSAEAFGGGGGDGGQDGRLQPLTAGRRGQERAEDTIHLALFEDKPERRGILLEVAFDRLTRRVVERVIKVRRQLVRGDHDGWDLSFRSMQSRNCCRTRQSVVRTQARLRWSRPAISSDEPPS